MQPSHNQHVIFKVDKNSESVPLKEVSVIKETHTKLNHCRNKGRWNKKEHIMFLYGIVKYGNNWKKIKELIKTRTNAQARSHGQKFFIKLKEHKQFSFGPFVNIKHFFHKIKGYTHSQKELLLQELKAIPFDSEEPYDEKEINFYLNERNNDFENENNLNNGCENESKHYQEGDNNSKQSTFEDITQMKNNSERINNNINNAFNYNQIKINYNPLLINNSNNFGQCTNNMNSLIYPYGLNQMNLESYVNQQRQQLEMNKYNLLLSSMLLNSYFLMNQHILKNMTNQV